MNTNYISFCLIIKLSLLLLVMEAPVFGQSRQRGGRSANSKQLAPQAKSMGVGRAAKHTFQNHANRMQPKAVQNRQQLGSGIGWQRAQRLGITQGQVQSLQPQIKHRLQNNLKMNAQQKANNWVASHAGNRATLKLKQTVNQQLNQQLGQHVVRHSTALHQRIRHLRHHDHHHLHWGWRKWCAHYPTVCHWWYSYCGPTYYFDPTCSVAYDWYYYYRCPVEVRALVRFPEVRWHLGLKCVLIPGKGLGIEAVMPDSPADIAGLAPGMIITSAGGRAIVDETSMPQAIDRSGGILALEVLTSAESAPVEVAVRMQRMLVTDH